MICRKILFTFITSFVLGMRFVSELGINVWKSKQTLSVEADDVNFENDDWKQNNLKYLIYF